MMVPVSHEYEIVWTGAMEVEAVKAKQIDPRTLTPKPCPRMDYRPELGEEKARGLVWDYLSQHGWTTMRALAEATCLSRAATSQAIHALHEVGAIERSGWSRSEPVRWRVR